MISTSFHRKFIPPLTPLLSVASNAYWRAQAWRRDDDNKKKSNFASSSHDTDNYRYEHLKQLIQNNPQTWHNIVCPYVENTITITEWFICKYVNGNWFAYVEENAKFGRKGFWIPSETESMNQTPNLHHKRVRN